MRSKLPQSGTTIFTVMNELAAKHKAINLGQGFPDFPMDEALIEGVHKAMKDNLNQYTHMNGYPLLRERIAEKIAALYSVQVHPDKNITITPGGTYALYTAITALVHPGDEVIVFEPAYDSYTPTIEINGGRAVSIPLSYPDYTIPWDVVRSKINDKTRAIILNSPHNPTGAVLTENDMRTLEAVIQDTDIMIISDEVYEHLVFNGLPHESVLKYPGLAARSFAVYSFGKVYNCTGWKLGYVVGPDEWMKEFRKIHQFNCFTCNTPMQVALADFLAVPEAYTQLAKKMQAQKEKLEGFMKATRFSPMKSNGSYFQLYSYNAMSKESENDFAVKLIQTAGVATIPVAAFYRNPPNHHVLRFCFCKKDEVLEEAANKLAMAGY
ncbi:MAG TPA: methionine aminotransferase [Ferruginibacter sp.]|nr:methionine aminotransferase [Ferruginibacter sp.]HRO17935.1 methionine aminotransferase [Ferruginibacter sp.]HRQ20022.1 methionine aminotransferase [Ferruginibacter sp.]